MGLTAGINRREFLKDAALFTGSFLGLDALLRTGALAEDKLEDELEEIFIRPYAEKVYKNPKPVIVLHSGIGRNDIAVAPSNRMRKVLLEVQKKYSEQIFFYEFKWENFLPLSDNLDKSIEYKKWFYDERFHKDMDFEQITCHPSTWMYHRKEVLTNEKFKDNHLLDIIRGGPTDDKWILPWSDWLMPWIETNIIKPNSEYVVRMNNSGKDQKYYYTK